MRKIKWWKRLAAAMMTAALLLPETTIYTQARTGQHVQTAVEQADNRAREADLTISSARELKEFAQKVNRGNTYQGKLIKLMRQTAEQSPNLFHQLYDLQLP